MSTISYSNKNEKFCLELDRVKLLLQKAGNPDKELSIIHVAGTNGKGSVCAFIEAGIKSQKIRCGRFSSPELFSSEDTITVDGVCIGKRALGNIVNSLAPLCSEVEKELGKPPSPFEILFVAALIHFKKKNCKKVILECGMGGVGDATNAIETSDMVVLTNIDLDHAEYLCDLLLHLVVYSSLSVFSHNKTSRQNAVYHLNLFQISVYHTYAPKSIQILFFRYTYQIEIPRGNISVAAQIKAISVGDLTHKARKRENILAPVVKGYEQLWRKALYRLARADKRLAL